MRKNIFTSAAVICCIVILSAVALSQNWKKEDLWAPVEERIHIWDEIAGTGNYRMSADSLEVTYEQDGAIWTIIGANARIAAPTVIPAEWPVNDFDLLVVPDPVMNYKILPFTAAIENVVSSDTLTITAARNSFEPASLVIRSGREPLEDVGIEITDLQTVHGDKELSEKSSISSGNIDVRVVKCWYQAGHSINDVTHKQLTPELLLHDDDLVRVDYVRQVNLIKNLSRIRDADVLQPFTVPRNQNKQVWMTVHIPGDAPPGLYAGAVTVTAAGDVRKKLNLNVQVLPASLPEPMIDYGLYYEGHLSGRAQPQIGWRPKTEKQMTAELLDMKEHGLTNATVRHQLDADPGKREEGWKRLQRTLELRKDIGWGAAPLLYLDWHPKIEDLHAYKKKIQTIASIAATAGIRDVYIYGIDERRGSDLLSLRPLYQAVHEAGAKNFVACFDDFLQSVPDLLDLPVLYGRPKKDFMAALGKLNIRVWNYGNPQAGLEEPATYRRNYGVNLVMAGFSGALDYVYQHGTCWNDFVDTQYRSHTMAYPTIDKPIPTIQWEGWRQGVNDVQFLTLLKQKGRLTDNWLQENCTGEPAGCREKIYKALSF